MSAILERIRGLLRGRGDRNVSRLQRRRVLNNFIWRKLPILRLILLFVGFAWVLFIPSPLLGQPTFIDENALHPGQVNTYWNWDDVHRADQYLAQLEQLRDRNASSQEIALFISDEFRKLGIFSSTQKYSSTTTLKVHEGTNAYAMLPTPRGSGAEATLISASWLSSSGDGVLNLRGVSTVLSLAAFLKEYSLWAKDFIFVICDGHLDGMQAFVTTYYGENPPNVVAEPLALPSGAIWAALNIDYPGHSFSHLGVFFEGLNGRLPNQDLYNSFQIISRHTGGVPVVLYDHLDPREYPPSEPGTRSTLSWVPTALWEYKAVREYVVRARNMLRHVGYQAKGKASGVHGLLHRFRIDAITIFAVPASGPHGFHAIGRILESTLRTVNNLLERLHASFFFYILGDTAVFLKIGYFLPSAVILSVAMMFSGLYEWVGAGYDDNNGATHADRPPKGSAPTPPAPSSPKPRPVLRSVLVVVATHAIGASLFCIMKIQSVVANYDATSLIILGSLIVSPFPLQILLGAESPTSAPSWRVVKALNLCLASTVVSVTCVLNFSLAVTLAMILSVPLIYSSPGGSLSGRMSRYLLYMLLGFGWMLLTEDVKSAMWNWELMGVWFAPFVCMVYSPLVLQSALVSILPTISQQ